MNKRIIVILSAFVLLSLTALSQPHTRSSKTAKVTITCNGLNRIYAENSTALPIGSIVTGGSSYSGTGITNNISLLFGVYGSHNPLLVTINEWDESVNPDGAGNVYLHSYLKIGTGTPGPKPSGSFYVTPVGTNCNSYTTFEVIPYEGMADATCNENNAVVFRFTFSVTE